MAFTDNDRHDVSSFERLNYYYGKLMTVDDFQTEQGYLNEKRWLLNRMATGWGVVCGLKVERNPECWTEVIVHPGLALDKYGNEIFVREACVIDLSKRLKEVMLTSEKTAAMKNYFICIKFAACLTAPSPVALEECGATETGCEYNRVREHFHIKAITEMDELYEEIRAQCEKTPKPRTEAQRDCAHYLEHPCAALLEPCAQQEKDAWLVLAKVRAKVTSGSNHLLEHVDNCSFRKLLFSNDRLAQTDACLKKELWRVRTARFDRRQFVPLLAQTVKGLQYRDGRNLIITNHPDFNEGPGKRKRDVGAAPYDITTDGDFIWFTDHGAGDESVIKTDPDLAEIHKLKLGKKSWGLAFDGEHIWATHHENDSVSRIPLGATRFDPTPPAFALPKEGANLLKPKVIIYAHHNLWVACENGLVRINPKRVDAQAQTCECQYLVLGFRPKAMAYDGSHIWMIKEQANAWELCKFDPSQIEENDKKVDASCLPKPSKGDNPQSIAFDGVYMWVTHSEGASKFDVNKNKEEGDAVGDTNLTGLAFDGSYLWAAGKKLYRIDVVGPERVDGFRPDENETKLPGSRHYAKMCFDGTHIWVTDHIVDRDEEQSQNKAVQRIGVIHRILV